MEIPAGSTRPPVGEDVLGQIETAGVFHATTRLSEPWGIDMPPLPQVVIYHLLTSGRATVEVGETSIELAPGDLLVVPRGTGHRILSVTGAATPLGPALRAFHAAPEQGWGLVRLAAVAGVSRSAFTARFIELAGTSAMAYVGECGWISPPGCSVSPRSPWRRRPSGWATPRSQGSPRAFQRRHGRAPGSWRTDPPDELAAAVASLESGAA